jgi:lyso-ornithine lipid O-acyltransferase
MRALIAGAAIAVITLTLIPVQWVLVTLKLPSRRRIPGVYHRMLCALLGVRIEVLGERSKAQPLLLVANHSSWLDVPIITAVAPVIFVAKQEVASWPLFGLLAKLQRSVFVNRVRRHKTGEVNAEIARRLAEGDPVVLFGEGTSSDGNRVLAFRTALIGAAGEALAAGQPGQCVMIQPLSIAYVGMDGLPMGRYQRPLAAWYGDMELLPHLLCILKRGALDVVVTFGEPIAFNSMSDRKQVARALHLTVRQLTAAALRDRSGARTVPLHSHLPEKPLRGGRGGNASTGWQQNLSDDALTQSAPERH